MIEIEGPLKFEQKEANETIQKLGKSSTMPSTPCGK